MSNANATAANKSKTVLLLVLFLLLLALLAVVLVTCKTQKQAANAGYIPRPNGPAPPLQIPAPISGHQVVNRMAFSLSYNEAHEQPDWVAYVLRGYQTLAADEDRSSRFFYDPLITTGSANDADYNGSGYDRGHLASAEDMAYSPGSMRESFYYSNVSPQVPAFNRGVWRRLEELIRYWSQEYDSLYTAAGPVLADGLPAIGPNGVSVPQRFYRVVLQYNPQGVRGIGFVIPNQASAAELRTFAVSIDSVENLTGLDFFPGLPGDKEENIEGGLDLEDWFWKRRKK